METDHNSGRLIPTYSSCIDEDLWPEIFKRLPTKSLCRFRCVCKGWESLISSAWIVDLHHSFTCSSTPANLKPYLVVLLKELKELCHNSYALCRPPQNNSTHVEHDGVHFPFRSRNGARAANFKIVGVIEGVICISYSDLISFHYSTLLLWNPAIHKYVALPCPPRRDNLIDNMRMEDFSSLGFGYDSCKNDFKVVRIWFRFYISDDDYETDCSSWPTSYELYSAREGVWRTATTDIKFRVLQSYDYKASCFLNGTIHWILDDSVLMFDCEREEFTTMELPEPVQGTLRLLEYGGMLSAAVHWYFMPFGRPTVHWVELWVMEEYGVASTWKKLYRVPDNTYAFTRSFNGIGQPLLERLAPCGPHPWLKLLHETYSHRVLCGHVYQESMFLMDDPKAQSYTKDEIVQICSKQIQAPTARDNSPEADFSADQLAGSEASSNTRLKAEMKQLKRQLRQKDKEIAQLREEIAQLRMEKDE